MSCLHVFIDFGTDQCLLFPLADRVERLRDKPILRLLNLGDNSTKESSETVIYLAVCVPDFVPSLARKSESCNPRSNRNLLVFLTVY